MRKTLVIATGILASAAFVSATAAYAGPVAQRQARQYARIHQGRQCGELARREVRALRHEQRHVERLRRQALADGRIRPREANALDRAQDRAGRHIYRLRHNAWKAAAAQ